ncbi:hypothetical protein E4U39_003936, partial [Claviceps sp. Clav50 group G5]
WTFSGLASGPSVDLPVASILVVVRGGFLAANGHILEIEQLCYTSEAVAGFSRISHTNLAPEAENRERETLV